MKVVVSWSGGKDSQAGLIWAVKKYGAKNVQAVFCDTGWEHELTDWHVKTVCENLGVELISIASKKYAGFLDMVKQKGRFPSTKARFCSTELKVVPFIDWILDHPDDRLIIQGIRSQESPARSKMDKQCTYFKFYFEPLANGKKATYRGKEVREYVKNYTTDIERPVFDWTAQEVIRFILDNGQHPNPLYYNGFSRVGCFPCIMCRHAEIKSIAEDHPEYIERLELAEDFMGRTFFPPDYIPRHAMTNTDPATGKKIPSVNDVVKYVTSDKNQTNLFEELKPVSCMSAFNICE